MDPTRIEAMATELIEAHDAARLVKPLTAGDAAFDVDAAYDVLLEIESRRVAGGWRRVGRKIGFTNRTIWERYGVDRPMWASVYDRTLVRAPGGSAEVSIDGLVQPRIEPEVAFRLRGPVPPDGDARAVLAAVDQIMPAFEVVQCPFPDWRFEVPDCTAAYGLHARLVVGSPVDLDDDARDELASGLPDLELTLARDGEIVATGYGHHVLDSPALALRHLARLLAGRPDAPPLQPGEFVTTGALTDAPPIEAGQTWLAVHGGLGLQPLTVVVR